MRTAKNPFTTPVSTIILIGLTLIAMFVAPIAGASPRAVDREDALQHFNRDVYVIVGASLRNPTAETPPDAPLYNDAGAYLDVTWGQWTSASASAMAHRIGGPTRPRTDVLIRLTGLIPNGVYSVFYITLEPDSEHPLCRGVERSLPLTKLHDTRGPDASSFVADESGKAFYHARVDGDLLAAGQVIWSIIYHVNRKTYHPLPNAGEWFTQGREDCRSSFGHDAMRQLLILQKSF